MIQHSAFNFIQGSDITGESSFDIWRKVTGNNSRVDFLNFLKSGPQGEQGEDGKSAFELWLEIEGNEDKSLEDFFATFKGNEGKSAYETWLEIEGNEGKTEEEFLTSLKGDKGDDGYSTYDIWKSLGNEGTASDFIKDLTGPQGPQGERGESGADAKSVYDMWKELGNEGSFEDFLISIKGETGKSAYQVWLDCGNEGTEEDFFKYITSTAESVVGKDGKSAYEIWLEIEGNEGKSIEEFLASLKGEPGVAGEKGDPGIDAKSTYEIWQEAGNEGGVPEFIESLRGLQGEDGKSAYETWLEIEGNEGKTEIDFINSLTGPAGKSTYDIWVELGYGTSPEEFIEYLKGPQGEKGDTPELTGYLKDTDDTQNNVVNFTSNDNVNPTEWNDIEVLSSGEKHSSLFNKISTMFKNVRYLFKMLGTDDISTIGNGTVKGAISTLNSDLINSIRDKSCSPAAIYQNIILHYFGGLVSLVVSSYHSTLVINIDTNLVSTSGLSTTGYKTNYLLGASEGKRIVVDGAVRENGKLRIKLRTNDNSEFICGVSIIGYGIFD